MGIEQEQLINEVRTDLRQLVYASRDSDCLNDFTILLTDWAKTVYFLAKENKLNYVKTIKIIKTCLDNAIRDKILLCQGQGAGYNVDLMKSLHEHTNNTYVRYRIYIFSYVLYEELTQKPLTTKKKDRDYFIKLMLFVYEANKDMYKNYADTDKWFSNETIFSINKVEQKSDNLVHISKNIRKYLN